MQKLFFVVELVRSNKSWAKARSAVVPETEVEATATGWLRESSGPKYRIVSGPLTAEHKMKEVPTIKTEFKP